MAAALLIRQSRRSWALAARVALSPAPSARACSGEASEPAVNAFLRERGYADDVAAGILKELTSNWGVKPGQELPMVKALAGAWEVGDDAGLNALAQAVERELARSQGKALVRFLIRPPGSGNRLIECDGFEGMSIKDVIDHGAPRHAPN